MQTNLEPPIMVRHERQPIEPWNKNIPWWGQLLMQFGSIAVVWGIVWTQNGALLNSITIDQQIHREDVREFRLQIETINRHDEDMRRITHKLIEDNDRHILENRKVMQDIRELLKK